MEGAIGAPPVVKAEGVITRGLYFGEEDTGTDCVDGPTGDVEAAIGNCPQGYEIVDHGGTVFDVLRERLRRDAGADTAVDEGLFVSVDDVPCFVFDTGRIRMIPYVLRAGMNLNGQRRVSVEKLDEDWEAIVGGELDVAEEFGAEFGNEII